MTRMTTTTTATRSEHALICGETFDGTARFLADRTEHERAMGAIRRKYWMYWPIMVLRRILTAIGVMHDNTRSFEVTLAE